MRRDVGDQPLDALPVALVLDGIGQHGQRLREAELDLERTLGDGIVLNMVVEHLADGGIDCQVLAHGGVMGMRQQGEEGFDVQRIPCTAPITPDLAESRDYAGNDTL